MVSTQREKRVTGDSSPTLNKRQRTLIMSTAITSLVLVILFLYLLPFGYTVLTSLKTKQQVAEINAPLYPAAAATIEYEGEELTVYSVPIDGHTRELALVNKGRKSSEFIDPANPEGGLITWEGSWRALSPAFTPSLTWSNYPEAFQTIKFLRLLGNTLMYALVTTFAAVFSAAIVAYGFARFRFPFKNVLFIILISTIILPQQATLIPTYAFFFHIGWVGTWLPLIIPQFFSNAYNVFLLRQYFLTIPREIEDAARVDGAGPVRIFWQIILPQAVPAMIAVALFHFFYAWNDFFGPLIYLAGNADWLPIVVALNNFNGLYSAEPQLIQAASIMTMIIPLLIFFFAQRFFMQGVVVTGVDK